MVFDQTLDRGELGLGEAVVGVKCDRLEPELGLEIVAGNVDVGRFRALAGVKVESGKGRYGGRWAWLMGQAG